MANGPAAKPPQEPPPVEGQEIIPAELERQLSKQFDRFNLSPQARSELAATVKTVVLQTEKIHSGPLPSADDFALYGQTLANAPERIMQMAERRVLMAETQQAHDHEIENKVYISESIYRILGLILGALLVAGMIGGSIYCAIIGAYAAATALGAGGAITGVGGIFVRGRDIATLKGGKSEPQTPQPTARLPEQNVRSRSKKRR